VRYYKIDIDDGGTVFTSLNDDGSTNPAALQVEMDVPVAPYATPVGAAWVRVWGVPLQQVAQTKDLNNKSVKVFGGMARGLPLANPAQAGLLVQGTIFPAFANWIGTDQTLDLIIAPPFGTPGGASGQQVGQGAPPGGQVANIVHNWKQGTPLSNAVQQALRTAFPNYTVNVNIGANLSLPRDDVGYYETMGQYASYIKDLSQKLNNSPTYIGVNVTVSGTTISVYDGSQSSGGGAGPTAIAFTDLIGQPTWLGLQTVQAKVVMRGDLQVGGQITLPPAQATVTAESFPQFRSSSAFQGTFTIIQLRHVGSSRQPDAASWCTIIDAAQNGGVGQGD